MAGWGFGTLHADDLSQFKVKYMTENNELLNFGLDILGRLRAIEDDITEAGNEGALSLIAACIVSDRYEDESVMQLLERIIGPASMDCLIDALSHCAEI